MKIAIHQPAFIPWFPFFYKMAMADKFIILGHVQFEKNNYQNRYKTNNKWVTKSINSGTDLISNKMYCDGNNVLDLNARWIQIIKDTLSIKTFTVFDYETSLTRTERLINLIHYYCGDVYITNPDAKEKYLNEDLMRKAGIEIEYCRVPEHLKIHTFEAFEKYGIDGTIKQLPKRINEFIDSAV